MTHEDPKHEAFARRLDEALDERRALDDPKWLDEAREDSANRELLEGYRALSEGMRQRRARPETRPAADLGARILSQVRAEAGLEKKKADRPVILSFPHPLVWAAAAAACLVIAPLVYFSIQNTQGPGLTVVEPAKKTPTTPVEPTIPKLVKIEPPVPAPPVAPTPSKDPALRTLVAEAGGRYLELAKETRESFADVALLLPGVSTAEPAGAAKKQWIDQVGDGLKPVTRSVGGAFDFLLQAIPIEEPRS